MEWTIHYLEEDGIVLGKAQGVLTWEKNRKFAEELCEMGRRKGAHKFFIDHQHSELGLTILEIDDLPKMLKEIGTDSRDKTAILYDPSSPRSSEFRFFENVAMLASLQFKVFSDKDRAIAWLKSDTSDESRK
jgi:hypothetical protein